MEMHNMDKNKTQGNVDDRAMTKGRDTLEPLSEAKIKHCLQECRVLTHGYVQQHFGAFWKAWIESVEKREENAHSNKEQVALGEMGRHLQRTASTSIEHFLRNLVSGFEQFHEKTLRTPTGQERFRGERLSLVDNAELEETIAITSICHRADSVQAEALWALQ